MSTFLILATSGNGPWWLWLIIGALIGAVVTLVVAIRR